MPRLRRLTPADATDLALIESAAWRAAYADILPDRSLARMTPEALAEQWSRRLRRKGELRWGILLGPRVVGYCTAGYCRDSDMEHGFAGEIFELYVHPRLQGRGLGRELMEQSWADLEGHGFRWGVLWVLEDNLAARRFYERCGLHHDGGRKRLMHGGRWVMAVRYSRALNRFDPFADPGTLPVVSRR
jgi:ribosomal protein S18 acetylase RimI-like enzyme